MITFSPEIKELVLLFQSFYLRTKIYMESTLDEESILFKVYDYDTGKQHCRSVLKLVMENADKDFFVRILNEFGNKIDNDRTTSMSRNRFHKYFEDYSQECREKDYKANRFSEKQKALKELKEKEKKKKLLGNENFGIF